MAESTHRINLIVTCTQAKRHAPVVKAASEINLDLPVPARRDEWARALATRASEKCVARDLYSGDHWSVASGLHCPDGDPATSIWVASAGYGLVSIDAKLLPYAATFRCGEDDSVCSSLDQAHLWWDELATLPPPVDGAPRTIEQLVALDPSAALMVVASPTYLAAMTHDIESAILQMDCQEQALVVSAGAEQRFPSLARLGVRFDARMQKVVGGAMQGLNARVARFIIQKCGFPGVGREDVQAELDRHSSKLPKFLYPQRPRQEDSAVLEFIRVGLVANPKSTKSSLLRELRDAGKACEQRRFGDLFQTAKVKIHVQD